MNIPYQTIYISYQTIFIPYLIMSIHPDENGIVRSSSTFICCKSNYKSCTYTSYYHFPITNGNTSKLNILITNINKTGKEPLRSPYTFVKKAPSGLYRKEQLS